MVTGLWRLFKEPAGRYERQQIERLSNRYKRNNRNALTHIWRFDAAQQKPDCPIGDVVYGAPFPASSLDRAADESDDEPYQLV